MSYARKSTVVQRYRNVRGHRVAVGMAAPRRSMSGWWDDLTGSIGGQVTDPQDSADIAACQAQAASVTADIDNKRLDLAANWRPTGFYSASDMNKMLATLQPMIDQARSMLAQSAADADNSSATGQLANALDELNRHTAQIPNYQAAAAQAASLPVSAPGFKDFVTKTMGSVSAAIEAAVTLSCLKPWLASVVDALGTAASAVWAAAKAITGAVLSVAGGAIKAVEETGGLLKYAPYAALAVGAFILVTELKRYKTRRS